MSIICCVATRVESPVGPGAEVRPVLGIRVGLPSIRSDRDVSFVSASGPLAIRAIFAAISFVLVRWPRTGSEGSTLYATGSRKPGPSCPHSRASHSGRRVPQQVDQESELSEEREILRPLRLSLNFG